MVSSSLDAVERSLRRLGGLAALLVLAAALAGIGRARRRRSDMQPERQWLAAQPAPLVETIGFLGLSGLVWLDLPIRLGPRVRTISVAAGGAALFSGLGLYLAGMAALGPAYDASSTFGARLQPGQRLVTTGPFSFVRHPMYVGLAIAAGGALLLYRTWTTLLFVAALRAVRRTLGRLPPARPWLDPARLGATVTGRLLAVPP